jgi:hypothetical protein
MDLIIYPLKEGRKDLERNGCKAPRTVPENCK